MPIRNFTLVNAAVADVVNTVNVGNAKSISVIAYASGIGAGSDGGSALIYFNVGNTLDDGTRFGRYEGLLPSDSGATAPTRAGSILMAGNGSSLYTFAEAGCFEFLEVDLDFDTDGVYTIILGIDEDQRS